MRGSFELGWTTVHHALPAETVPISLPCGPVGMEYQRKSIVELEIRLIFRSLHIWVGCYCLLNIYISVAILYSNWPKSIKRLFSLPWGRHPMGDEGEKCSR